MAKSKKLMKRSWLISTIFFLILGLGLLFAGLYTPSTIHMDCDDVDVELGIWRICGRNMSAADSIWSCRFIIVDESSSTPHWLSSIQILSFVTLGFILITCLICTLYLRVETEGNDPMGIAAACMTCASLLIIITVSIAGHFSLDYSQDYLVTMAKSVFDIQCKQAKFETSYSLLLTGIATVIITLAGTWALLASCLISSGIGNISSRGVYATVPTNVIAYDFEHNYAYSDDSDSDDYTSTPSSVGPSQSVSRHVSFKANTSTEKDDISNDNSSIC